LWREKKQKRRRKKKKRGRGVREKGVTNCWDFFGNFIIFCWNLTPKFGHFKITENSNILRIPLKDVRFSEIPTTTTTTTNNVMISSRVRGLYR